MFVMLVCQGLVVFEEFRRFRICMVQACRRLFSVLYRASLSGVIRAFRAIRRAP